MHLESVITTQNNVNTLFSNADNMSQEELDTKFEDIIKEGENAVVLSGKLLFLPTNIF